MNKESFDWVGKRARKTLAGLLVVTSAWYFGISGIRSYLSNRDSRDYANLLGLTDVKSSDVEIRTQIKKAQPEFETYIVKYGDTLSEIAERQGVPMRELVYWNKIQNPDLIYEKQKLRIPVWEETE
ncbi:MAG: LysM domain-containing protein [Nanoarchaeota archaeon]|nr:LysM domain-containing protein [Nanoarchaeota archaeon]